MFELLSNMGLFAKFARFVALAPLVLKFVEIAEDHYGPGEGSSKKKMVVDMASATTAELVKRGMVPAQLAEDATKTAGDLADIAVKVYNAVGYFHKDTPKE